MDMDMRSNYLLLSGSRKSSNRDTVCLMFILEQKKTVISYLGLEINDTRETGLSFERVKKLNEQSERTTRAHRRKPHRTIKSDLVVDWAPLF